MSQPDLSSQSFAPTWIIVSQVKSHRVVYFTDDPDYQPATEGDWYYCSAYQGALPPGMTLRNCWGWRFNGGTFADARERNAVSGQERLLEANRTALQRLLREKVDAVRAPFLPDCAHGAAMRERKLAEARRYLGEPERASATAYPLLASLAVARNISVLEAARLIEAKAEETERVLAESERFREQLKHAIAAASTQAELLQLREWLLDKVYPALSEKFAYAVQDTEPPDLDSPVAETHRRHEIARLKAQLREAINRQRESLHSGYIGNDDMRKQKARLAQALLALPQGHLADHDAGPVGAYAQARRVGLEDACLQLVGAMNRDAELLARTEKLKDEWLARIDAIRTLRDVREASIALAGFCEGR